MFCDPNRTHFLSFQVEIRKCHSRIQLAIQPTLLIHAAILSSYQTLHENKISDLEIDTKWCNKFSTISNMNKNISNSPSCCVGMSKRLYIFCCCCSFKFWFPFSPFIPYVIVNNDNKIMFVNIFSTSLLVLLEL